MEEDKDVKHKFNLTGMKAGDVFLGCNKCWFQLDVGAAAYPFCPNCDKRLKINTVRASDMVHMEGGDDS